MKYMIDPEQFKQFIDDENCYIVMDTSVILCLYENASILTKTIIRNLNKEKQKLWLPAQVLEEYENNKESTKKQAFGKYKQLSKQLQTNIDSMKKQMMNKLKECKDLEYPNISETQRAIRTKLDELKTEIKENFTNHNDFENHKNREFLNNEVIEKFIEELEQNKQIGASYLPEKLAEIYDAGEKRYKYKMPPGYMDEKSKDKNDPTKTKKYGDLVLWKQILDKAKMDEIKIIFVINDRKEDWWILNEQKDIVGPRKKLLKEYNQYAKGKDGLLMLTLLQFHQNLLSIHGEPSISSIVELEGYEISKDYFNGPVGMKLEFFVESFIKVNRALKQSYDLKNIEYIKTFKAAPMIISEKTRTTVKDHVVTIKGAFKYKFHAKIDRTDQDQLQLIIELDCDYELQVNIDEKPEKKIVNNVLDHINYKYSKLIPTVIDYHLVSDQICVLCRTNIAEDERGGCPDCIAEITDEYHNSNLEEITF